MWWDAEGRRTEKVIVGGDERREKKADSFQSRVV